MGKAFFDISGRQEPSNPGHPRRQPAPGGIKGRLSALLLLAPLAVLFIFYSCGGTGNGSSDALTLAILSKGGSNPPPSAEWASVTQAINDNASKFNGGLAVEIATTDGVVYSYAVGGFANTDRVMIASASKWVTATVILRLVDQGVLDLDWKMSDYLKDRNGNPWSGNMGDIKLRNLLSFTSGISGDDVNTTSSTSSEAYNITLAEAVYRIYDDQHAGASVPGSYFYYGNTHMRIAARLAEVRTGLSWEQIFEQQLRNPLGWSASSYYMNYAKNPNPAGGLKATGLEYMRFMMLQLREGLDGTTTLLPASLIAEQRTDQFLSTTSIAYSPYVALAGLQYHYGLGNWRECSTPDDPSACDAALRVSSTGTYGWAPWIDVQENYAGVIMTKQPLQGTIKPSEDLKNELAGLIPGILALNPPVIRTVP